MKIAFIGAGEIGTAMFDLIKHKNDLDIFIYDKDESLVPDQISLPETVEGADVVFVCIPSKFVRNVVEEFAEYLSKDAVVVSISKGIEIKSKKTMDQVLEEVLPAGNGYALLSGPMLGEELSDGLIGAAVIASKSEKIQKIIADIFDDTNLKTTTSKFVRGVALTGVLKNVYAIAFGMFESLCYGTNAKGWLFATAIEEMSVMIDLLGAEKEAAYGMSGLGDLIATGFSPYSTNFTLGYELARGEGKDISSEGLISLPSIMDLLEEKFDQFPVAVAVKQIVLDQKDAKDIFDELLYN